VQIDAWLGLKLQVPDPEISCFLDTRTGIVQEQQEGAVAQRRVSCCRQACDERLDLIAL